MRPHMRVRLERKRRWQHDFAHRRRLILAIGLLVALAVVMGNRPDISRAADQIVPVSMPDTQALGSQSYFDGLTVTEGQTLSGDVVVWSGDARVESGGTVDGGLVVYQGDVDVETDGEVTGDVTAWSGDVTVDGTVGGSISAVRGDVSLGDAASVAGDVSTLNGDIERADSARIGGNIVRSPSLNIPQGLFGDTFPGFGGQGITAPDAPQSPSAPESQSGGGQNSLAGRFFGMLLRLFLAALSTVFVTLAAVVLFSMRPEVVQRTQDAVRANPTRAFALGISVNLALWLGVFIFSNAWCLAVLAVVPALLLLFVNVVGFAAVSRIVGQRLGGSLRAAERKPVVEVALGALLLAAILNFIPGLIGGGSGQLFGLIALFVTAPGVGAFVQPWIEGYRSRRGQGAPGAPRLPVPPVPPAPAAPSQPPARPVPPLARPVTPVASPAPATPQPEQSELAPVAPAKAVASDAPVALQPDEPVRAEPVASADTSLNAELGPQPVAQVPYVFTLPDLPAEPAEGPGLTLEEVVSAADAERAAAEIAAVAAREQAVEAALLAGGDDFTRITGIGRSAERKLKAAGIMRYAQLAALPLEMIGSIMGVSVEEVIEDEIVKQASGLAQGSQAGA